jgi:hypothetical protein
MESFYPQTVSWAKIVYFPQEMPIFKMLKKVAIKVNKIMIIHGEHTVKV